MTWIYETPWWLPAALALVGIVVLWAAKDRREKKLIYTGGGLVALAGIIALVSYLLESDRECVERQTKETIQAIANRQWPPLDSLLHDDIAIGALRGRQAVIQTARFAVEAADLRSVRVTSVATRQNTAGYASQVQIYADFRNGNAISNWDFKWEKTPGGWRLREAIFLGGPGIPESEIDHYLRPR